MDTVREYSPPKCTEVFGKIIDIADSILLGTDSKASEELKGLFRYASVSAPDTGFANRFLYFPVDLQSKSWIPCLQKHDLRGCNEPTSPTLLYPKAEELRDTVEAIVNRSRWANESSTLTTAWLNYLGEVNYYHNENSTRASTSNEQDSAGGVTAGQKLGYTENWLAWSYQQCTEMGLFITGDNPKPEILSIYSRTQTLHFIHFIKNMYCRKQLHTPINETSVNPKLKAYGGLSISYPRLMFTGGEVDLWRQATQLATLEYTPTRLNYSSNPDQPWYLIAGASHICDLQDIFPNQTAPGAPPEAIKRVHFVEKEAIIRWLSEWRETYPEKSVRRR